MNTIKVLKGYLPLNIKSIEKKFNGKYIGDFELPNANSSILMPKVTSVFYNENPDISKGHSNYFGVGVHYNIINNIPQVESVYIQDAKIIEKAVYHGLVTKQGILVSCHRHHYITSKNKKHFIDGGLDYIHCSKGAKIVKVIIKNGKLELL